MSEEPVIYAGCQCGERYPVPLKGADLETLQFTCPKCGKTEGFTDEQIFGLKQHFGDAVQPLSSEFLAKAEAEPAQPQ